jgi:hypothetical protein
MHAKMLHIKNKFVVDNHTGEALEVCRYYSSWPCRHSCPRCAPAPPLTATCPTHRLICL